MIFNLVYSHLISIWCHSFHSSLCSKNLIFKNVFRQTEKSLPLFRIQIYDLPVGYDQEKIWQIATQKIPMLKEKSLIRVRHKKDQWIIIFSVHASRLMHTIPHYQQLEKSKGVFIIFVKWATSCFDFKYNYQSFLLQMGYPLSSTWVFTFLYDKTWLSCEYSFLLPPL